LNSGFNLACLPSLGKVDEVIDKVQISVNGAGKVDEVIDKLQISVNGVAYMPFLSKIFQLCYLDLQLLKDLFNLRDVVYLYHL